MKILSHRGHWKSLEEKNTRSAFERSFKLGYGTETDLRDHNGEIVISHDIPIGDKMTFVELLNIANQFSSVEAPLTLALNVKADGLQDKIASLMSGYRNISYFLFDMSVPDMRLYLEKKLPLYTRYSEIEKNPVYFEESKGVWLDNFSKDIWYSEKDLTSLLSKRNVCIVSSELHNNDPFPLWTMLNYHKRHDNLFLCTDRPEEAFEFFERKSNE